MGIAPDSVTALSSPRGYNFNRADEDGDLWYDAMLLRTPTRVYAFMAQDKLVKFRVFLNTPDANAVTTYQNARAELVRLYGRPKETIEEYDVPHKKGDTRQLKAIKEKKVRLSTYWLPGGRTSHVSVEVTPDLTVMVDYESAAWDRESLRRRKGAK